MSVARRQLWCAMVVVVVVGCLVWTSEFGCDEKSRLTASLRRGSNQGGMSLSFVQLRGAALAAGAGVLRAPRHLQHTKGPGLDRNGKQLTG